MNRTEYSSIRLRSLAVALFGGLLLAVSAVGCSESESQGDIAATGSTTGDIVLENGTVPASLLLTSDGRLTVSAESGDAISGAESGATRAAISGAETSATRADISAHAATRAVAVNDSAVGNVWVLQFDTSSSAAGKLVYRAFVSSGIRQNGMNVKVPVMLLESTSSVIVVVANSPETLDVGTLPDDTTLDELRTRTFEVTSTKGESLPSDTSARLPMYGESAPMAVSLVGSVSIPVNLTRLVSCMELQLVNNFASGYPLLQLTEVTLHNAPVEVAYSPLTPSATHMGTVFPAASNDNFRDYEPVTAGLSGETATCKWYIAPNRRGTGTATTADDKSAFTAPAGQGNYCTYISVRGKVKSSSGAAAEDVVYNIWLGSNSTDDYNLWANGYYKARLSITGFNGGQMEVGYDGISVNIGDWDALSDNTIIGWHPDTGLEYIPSFYTFSPERIDFGNAEAPEAQKVTFRINSGWRFSYTSGDTAKVISSSSVAVATDQTGGAQGEPADCEVSFTPTAYHAQNGTPVAGTQYSTVATFTTVGGDVTDIRTTTFIRTVPTLYSEPSVSPSSGTIARAGATFTATMSANAAWSVSATPGTSATQDADSYASHSQTVTVSANDTWQSRTVKVAVQYGDKNKEWSYTQLGMTITSATISPDPTDGIRPTGDRFAVVVNGDFGSVPVRAISGSSVLSSTYATPGNTVVLSVPANQAQSNRDISFQYQQDGVWKTIKSGTQGFEQIAVEECPLTDIGLGFYVSRSIRYQCIVVFWDNVNAHCKKFGYRMPNMNEVRQIYENRSRLTGDFRLTDLGGSWYTDESHRIPWSCYVSDQRDGVIDVSWGWTVWNEFGKGRGVDDSRCVKDKPGYQGQGPFPVDANGVDLGSYYLENPDPSKKTEWYNAETYCSSKGSGWRLPTKDELLYIYTVKDKIVASGGNFSRDTYWSSDFENGLAVIVNVSTGATYGQGHTTYLTGVRCVKNK